MWRACCTSAFQEDGIVAERRFGFTPGCFDHGWQFSCRKCQADAAPAAARGGLDQHRVLDFFGHIERQFHRQRFIRPGDDWQAGFA